MARGRRWLIVIGAVTIALVALGLWRRSELVDERAAARSAHRTALHLLTATRRALVATTTAAGTVEDSTAGLHQNTTELVGIADALTHQIRDLEKSRDDAALAAWVAGGQVGQLRECLGGVNRALNQVSVGDPNSVQTLAGVRNACRAVGA